MKGNVDAMFFNAGVADCETLNNLLSAKYEANKEDVANLTERGGFSVTAERMCRFAFICNCS